MTFQHTLLKPLNVSSVTTSNGRHYNTETLRGLPSVTTVLGRMLPHDGLDAWRARVGEEEANRIMKQAGRRGSIIHDTCEQYVLNKPINFTRMMPVNVETFKAIASILDEHVGNVYGVELPLYSKVLWTAGRTDLMADWDGIPSIIDFKTSRRIKQEEDIISYFYQASVYAYMASMIYKIPFKQLVIVMAIDHEPPKVFTKPVKDYADAAFNLFLEHKRQYKT